MANTNYIPSNNEGMKLSVFAGLPATYDKAGYEAVAWQEANNCVVTEMPNIGGATWDTAFADKTFCAGGGMQFKDKSNRQAKDMTMGYYYNATDADAVAFNAIIEASEAVADGKISLKQESSDGVYVKYVTLKVFDVEPDNAAPDGKAKLAVGMIPQSEVVKVVV